MTQPDIDLIKITYSNILAACQIFEKAGFSIPGEFQLIKQKAQEMLSRLESGIEIKPEEVEQLTSQLTALSKMDINNN